MQGRMARINCSICRKLSRKSARSGVDERALAFRMDERAHERALCARERAFGSMACEGTRMVRHAGQVGRINCAMCSQVLFMEEGALLDGPARARAPDELVSARPASAYSKINRGSTAATSGDSSGLPNSKAGGAAKMA